VTWTKKKKKKKTPSLSLTKHQLIVHWHTLTLSSFWWIQSNPIQSNMDPPLINEKSFSAANPSSYSLTEIWPFPPPSSTALGLRMANLADRDGSVDESTVTEQRGGNRNGNRKARDLSSEEDDSSIMVSTTTCAHDLVRFCFIFLSLLYFLFIHFVWFLRKWEMFCLLICFF